MQARYHLSAWLLFALLGAANPRAEAQVDPQLAKRYFDEPRSSASGTPAGCGVCRSAAPW